LLFWSSRRFCTWPPGLWLLLRESPWPRNRGDRAAPFPAYRVAGGRGFEGEKKEGSKSYLWRGSGLADVGYGGLAAERGGWRRTGPRRRCSRRGKEGVAGCRRFWAARWSYLGGRLSAKEGGRVSSAGAKGGAALAVLSKGVRGTWLTGSGVTKRRSETSLSIEGRVWASQARGRARCGRPGRHGVAVAVRRPSSTSAPWIATRGEAENLQEKPRVERTGGAARERRVAGKRRAAVGSARPGRNREGEGREERES